MSYCSFVTTGRVYNTSFCSGQVQDCFFVTPPVKQSVVKRQKFRASRRLVRKKKKFAFRKILCPERRIRIRMAGFKWTASCGVQAKEGRKNKEGQRGAEFCLFTTVPLRRKAPPFRAGMESANPLAFFPCLRLLSPFGGRTERCQPVERW